MKKFFFQVLAGILGLYLAAKLLPNVTFMGPRYILLLAGTCLGILNYFIKPALNFFFFPLRLLTLGLIGLVIDVGIVWFVATILFSDYIKYSGLTSLLFTTIIIWACSFFFSLLSRSFRERQHHRYYD